MKRHFCCMVSDFDDVKPGREYDSAGFAVVGRCAGDGVD